MGISRQEHGSRLPCPPPGDLPDPGIEPGSLTSALAGKFIKASATMEAPHNSIQETKAIKQLELKQVAARLSQQSLTDPKSKISIVSSPLPYNLDQLVTDSFGSMPFP